MWKYKRGVRWFVGSLVLFAFFILFVYADLSSFFRKVKPFIFLSRLFFLIQNNVPLTRCENFSQWVCVRVKTYYAKRCVSNMEQSWRNVRVRRYICGRKPKNKRNHPGLQHHSHMGQA